MNDVTQLGSVLAPVIVRSGSRAVETLKAAGLPHSDQIELRRSSEEFAAGGQYGVEIPVINNMSVLQRTVEILEGEGIMCTRFNETHGSFLLSDAEISEMLHFCSEHGYGMVFGLGPRPEYDVKASFYRSEFGLEMKRQLNNLDAISHSVEEAFRLVELGCRGIIVYDVGVLRLLSRLRERGDLPKSLLFKTSSHCMASNPYIAEILRENGADSITTAHDLGLPVLQEMRRLNPGVVLDIPTDVYKTKGGFIRYYELAEMIQVASPIFLKMGASAQGHPYDTAKDQVVAERVRRVSLGLECLARQMPDLKPIGKDSEFRCLPELKG